MEIPIVHPNDPDRCEHCKGTGFSNATWSVSFTCICCDGTGKQSSFVARVIAGKIRKYDLDSWAEPHENEV